jgi:NAD(P)H-hydrate epimerase
VLIIGGSSLFHGAVIWAAEAASLLADMVHVASTEENNDIIRSLKVKWQTGIVIHQTDIPEYAHEDGVILVGNGMMRDSGALKLQEVAGDTAWDDIVAIKNEGMFTREAVYHLICSFPDKQFVFDAGALQMMNPGWLKKVNVRSIITPHQKEFTTLFGIDLTQLSIEDKQSVVIETARKYNCIIVLKAVEDIITDGTQCVRVVGGNAGLTKGGTGDILAGIIAGLVSTSDAFASAVCGSYMLKKTADTLFTMKGYWYSVHEILDELPHTLKGILGDHAV